jgi:heme/copper-type cytochrome/quinol oxidase subunit 4
MASGVRAIMESEAEAQAQMSGLQVVGVLAVLTVVEYFIAIGFDSSQALVLLLSPIALLKGWLILHYFMHLPKVWGGEGH